MQLRINDVHGVFEIFSSRCVKGGLGLRNSRLGTPWSWGKAEGMEGLIWYSSYVYLWCGRSRGGRWAAGIAGATTRANTNTDAHVPSARAGILNHQWHWKSHWWGGLVSFVFLPPLTCDLPNGAEHVEFLRIQRLNIVVDVPASGKQNKLKTADWRIYFLFINAVESLDSGTAGGTGRSLPVRLWKICCSALEWEEMHLWITSSH